MDHYTASPEVPAVVHGAGAALPLSEESSLALGDRDFREPLRFPGDDGGRSLNEMAERDLEAALQLLVERAQYITGAAGAAIALREGEEMICRASAGPSAPALGSRVDAGSGLSGESVRTGEILCCNDTGNDSRVNRESCLASGIASAMVMPLQRRQNVVGIFELFSSRTNAFEERDLVALQRLGEMIQTAIEHAEAAKNAQSMIASDGISMAAAAGASATAVQAVGNPASLPGSAPTLLVERGKIGRCTACGFPVSEGRTLCLDCENSRGPRTALADPVLREASHSATRPHEAEPEGWLQSHKYLIGALVAAIIIVTAVIFLR